MHRFILAAITLASCSFFSFSFYTTLGFDLSKMPKVDVVIDKMLGNTLTELQTIFQPLSIIGVGGSQDNKQETKITVSFVLKRPLTKGECRKLLVISAEALLKNINQNEDLKPYLCHIPFTYRDIEIYFILNHFNGSDIKYPDISTISLIKGVIDYDTSDPNDPDKYNTELELYKDALQIVCDQKLAG